METAIKEKKIQKEDFRFLVINYFSKAIDDDWAK